jgi:Spy/CpxP family protein refolding chaperone
MRIITTMAAGAALTLAVSANALAQSAPAQSAPAQPPAAAPSAETPAITSVTVVDVKDLPEETQKQVDDVVAQRGDEDLKKLRASIESMPELKSALEAKGATSNDVIAASMAEGGALTLITKKAG